LNYHQYLSPQLSAQILFRRTFKPKKYLPQFLHGSLSAFSTVFFALRRSMATAALEAWEKCRAADEDIGELNWVQLPISSSVRSDPPYLF
jgi:hypothetical protein